MSHRILIVDDHLHILHTLEAVFASHGYDVITTTDAEEAADLIVDMHPDLVIIDDRFVADLLEQPTPSIPLVVLTGRVSADSAVENTSPQIIDTIAKPCSPRELLELVRDTLDDNWRDVSDSEAA